MILGVVVGVLSAMVGMMFFMCVGMQNQVNHAHKRLNLHSSQIKIQRMRILRLLGNQGVVLDEEIWDLDGEDEDDAEV